jgi:hypothetical protein
MLKIVPEVSAESKSCLLRSVAQVAEPVLRTACSNSNHKNTIKNKHVLVIGFVI